MRKHIELLLYVSALIWATACTPFETLIESATKLNQSSGGKSPTPTPTPLDVSKLTFSSDLGPLLMKNCAGCHNRNHGVAPFALETYTDIKNMAASIKSAVSARRMPPPSVDNSGSCNSFVDSGWLADLDIQKITGWIDNNMPIGDPNYVPAVPTPSVLQNVTKTLTMPAAYTPAPPTGKLDDYRCFIVDPGVTANTMITGIEIRPDKHKQVHHVIVFKPASAAAQTQAEQKNGVDGKPGYSCFGAAGVASTIVGLWAPGGNSGEMRDPETGAVLGLRLEAGRKLIMQVHYNTQSGAQPDQSSIALVLNSNATPVRWMLMANFLFNLAPETPSIDSSATITNRDIQALTYIYEQGLGDEFVNGNGTLTPELIQAYLNAPPARNMRIYGLGPHAHRLARSITMEKIAGGQNQCLARVPKYDFNWQRGYFYTSAKTMDAGDSMKINCNFSTIGKSTTTKFGEGTEDEMCLAFFLTNE